MPIGQQSAMVSAQERHPTTTVLDRGERLYFVGSLTPSTKPDEPDAKSKEPLTYAILEATSRVGFV
jgi:hypothetical protein